jgi:hypothetical protein
MGASTPAETLVAPDRLDVAGAPALDEIEITQEMIEAACEAASLYERDDPREWEWIAVYRAIEKARRKALR